MSQYESIKMKQKENITSFFKRIDEVVNTIKALGKKVNEQEVVQKILRSLPLRFNPKVSSIEKN